MNNQLTEQLTGKVLFWNINQRLAVVDEIFVWISDCSLHQAPVGHPAISRHRVEVEIVVQVVRTPFDLSLVLLVVIFGVTAHFPHDVFVFPIACWGSVDWPHWVRLQIVHGHITIVQPGYHHVGVLHQQHQQQDTVPGPPGGGSLYTSLQPQPSNNIQDRTGSWEKKCK